MQMTISLADYGVGNLHSIKKALENSGGRVNVVTEMEELIDAECIVFPGVGAFDRTMEKLRPYRDEIRRSLENGTPALGICIGAHILFEGSEEGMTEGIGFMDGRVVRLKAKQIPHIGWNSVVSRDPVFEGIGSRYFYFAHSYRGDPSFGSVIAGETEYEGRVFPTLFRKENVYGCQFHPEKSSSSGLRMIRNFIGFAEGSI